MGEDTMVSIREGSPGFGMNTVLLHQRQGAFLLEVRVESEENIFPMVPAGAPVADIRFE